MPDINSVVSIKSLWNEKLRSSLHNPENWTSSNNYNCKLVHVPTGYGFHGQEQMKKFFEQFGACNIFNEGIQTVSCAVDENSGQVFDEFVLEWIQKSSRMEWMLPGHDFPLQKYRLSFVISAQIDPNSKLLQSVRVYWDQASLLLQTGVLMRSIKQFMRPNCSEALENALTSLPISSNWYRGLLSNTFTLDEDKPVIGGGLNSITSILNDLPRSTSGPAVMTPQRPTTSRSLNPMLLGSLKLGDDQSLDSPLPKNSRNVKSRNIFFEDEEETAISVNQKKQPVQVGLFDKITSSDSYRPGLATNSGAIKNSKSQVFANEAVEDHKYNHPSLQSNETFSHQYESQIFSTDCPIKKVPSNLPQTDKILFESHVFDAEDDPRGLPMKENHVATAPPQCPSRILSPEENLKYKPEPAPSTLSRPGMLGHFRGASLGDTLNEAETKFIPSTAIRFDPNKSQIVLGGYIPDEDDHQQQQQSYNQLPSLKLSSQSGNKSSIFD